MTTISLQETLAFLIAGWECECVEFKEANDNFSTSDIGKYFSALANEANLRGLSSAWLVFGVNNRKQRSAKRCQGDEPSSKIAQTGKNLLRWTH